MTLSARDSFSSERVVQLALGCLGLGTENEKQKDIKPVLEKLAVSGMGK